MSDQPFPAHVGLCPHSVRVGLVLLGPSRALGVWSAPFGPSRRFKVRLALSGHTSRFRVGLAALGPNSIQSKAPTHQNKQLGLSMLNPLMTQQHKGSLY